MDEIDRAAAQEEALRQEALRVHYLNAATPPADRWARLSLRHCEACGEPIGEARRRAVPGVRRCVACQTRTEAAQRW